MDRPCGIYVETRIRTQLDSLWSRTQLPEQHEKWDLRFSHIEYLPRSSAMAPQRFRYATRIGFGLRIEGDGESIATRYAEDGSATSSLKFWSGQKRSLIKAGTGYWAYVPDGDGIRFKTWYDYTVRHGAFGRVVDVVFRPLLGWATALSFDVLRLWLEKDLAPADTRSRYLTVLLSNTVLAFAWIYQGLVPKLLRPHSGEIALQVAAGVPPEVAPLLVIATGICEVIFGALFLARPRSHMLHLANLLGLPVLAAAVVVRLPHLFVAPFNPAVITVTMMALSILVLTHLRDLPNPANCIRSSKP